MRGPLSRSAAAGSPGQSAGRFRHRPWRARIHLAIALCDRPGCWPRRVGTPQRRHRSTIRSTGPRSLTIFLLVRSSRLGVSWANAWFRGGCPQV